MDRVILYKLINQLGYYETNKKELLKKKYKIEKDTRTRTIFIKNNNEEIS